jgi:hypothetical protein
MNSHALSNYDLKYTLFYVLSITLTVIILVCLLGAYYEIGFRELTADPNVLGNRPFYSGLLSQLGLFCWSAAATISFIFAFFSKNSSKHKRLTAFYVYSGLLISLLMFDDAFMFHETVFPSLGISQKFVYISYALLTLAYLSRFYKTILKTPYLLLLFAFGSFSVSTSIDVLFHFEGQSIWNSLVEDGSKFTGIVFWMIYMFKTHGLIFDNNTEL